MHSFTLRFLLYCSTIIICPLFVYCQQNTYTINGKIDSLKDGDKLYMIYQVGDRQVTDSAVVKQSRFSFRGLLTDPVYAAIYLNRNPYVKRMQPGETLDFMRLYIEPSAIQLKANDSLKHATVSGSNTDLQNRQLQDKLKANNEQWTAMVKEFEAMPKEKQKDTVVFRSFTQREQQLLQDSYDVHLAFANEHPDAYLSVISLSHIAAQPTMTQRAAKAYARLSPRLKQTTIGQGIAVQLAAPENTRIGKLAPDFEQTNPQGKKVRLSDFRKQYVLLDFWASWCGPCREENPNVLKAYNRWKDKGFTVFGVSLDGPGQRAAWLKAIESDGLVWPQVADMKGWENSVAKIYGVRSIPLNFLIGPDGKIIAKDLRGPALTAELEKLLK